MALHLLASSNLPSLSPARLRPSSVRAQRKSVRCMNPNATVVDHSIVQNVRRSGNYQPNIWDNDFIQSLNTEYSQESSYIGRAEELKKEVKTMLGQVADPLGQLELIDVLERLGLSHNFERDIDMMLMNIFNNFGGHKYWEDKGLYASALAFRLLRQHEYDIPQDFFVGFMDESKNVKECLCGDMKGMLSLYEASYLSVEGETILQKARDFATKHLQQHVKKCNEDDQEISLATVRHALEIPLQWRVARIEHRWFIDMYQKRKDKNDILLELAKLDFNMVQAIHQQDLKHTSRWWHDTNLAQKLSFSRDRLMENFLWTVGFTYEPQFQYERRMMTKIFVLITTIDDIYDVYGSLDELKLFTKAVERSV